MISTQTSQKTVTPNAIATKVYQIGDSRIREIDKMVQVFVPAGEFEMGSHSGYGDESPILQVYVDDFWIDKSPISQEQYLACVKSGYCTNMYERNLLNENQKETPITNINWFEANEYCDWVGARLPSEAEWEKAARGIDGRLYPWGNEKPKDILLGNNDNEIPDNISPYGANNLVGHNFEWVNDWYSQDFYVSSSRVNPIGPSFGSFRVVRGGSYVYVVHVKEDIGYGLGYYGLDHYYRTPYVVSRRHSNNPDIRQPDLGFRCVNSNVLDSLN